MDIRFGGRFLGGGVETRFASLGAYNTANSDYGALEFSLSKIRMGSGDVFVDVGCGKGRVINYLLHRGFTGRIIGVELDDEIASFTRRRLRRYANVQIRSGNILDNLPEDATIFYLFNPFCAEVMKRFKEKIEASFGRVIVIYYNDCFIDVFQNHPGWKIITFRHPRYHSLSIAEYTQTAELGYCAARIV